MESEFMRFNIQTNIFYRFTKEIQTKLRVWVGGFLNSDNLPKQYRTYLSGAIDPDFRNNFIFNRTGEINDISIGTRQYEIGGPAMHGLILDESRMKGVSDWVVSANFDITIPRIPGRLFADIAVVPGKKTYIDFGLKKSFGLISIILPLYQNWEQNRTLVNNADWVKDRIRFSMNFSQFNFRDLF